MSEIESFLPSRDAIALALQSGGYSCLCDGSCVALTDLRDGIFAPRWCWWRAGREPADPEDCVGYLVFHGESHPISRGV